MAQLYDLREEYVLVTGGAGFIGSALVRELLKEGARVVVYDNFLYGDMSNIKELLGRVEVVRGDVLSWKIFKVLRDYNIKYVFHLAAEPYIPNSYEYPEKFFDVNVKGTLNVLMACKTAGVKRVVFFSSSEVYGSAQYVPMDEKHPTVPLSTYAVSKLAADRLSYVLSREHKVPVIIIRPFNCYGPRETQPYVIPEIISQLARGRTLRLGNVKARRDFTYMDDIAKGAIAVMKADIEDGSVINLGSNRTYSIEEVAKLIGRLMKDSDVEIITDPSRIRPIDVELLQCDYSKARSLIGWSPKINLEEGLKLTIEWYRKNGNRWVYERFVSP